MARFIIQIKICKDAQTKSTSYKLYDLTANNEDQAKSLALQKAEKEYRKKFPSGTITIHSIKSK